MKNIDISKYNPIFGGAFRSGQLEAITTLVQNFESGIKEQTLDAPTAAGKTLDLIAFGNILNKEFGISKILYTSPQVALIESGNLFGLPKLTGKSNYPCLGIKGYSADDCLFPGNKSTGWAACDACPYKLAKAKFRSVDFGATTFARYLVDPLILRETSALLIDESSNLFNALINASSIELPLTVFNNASETTLYEALRNYWSKLLLWASEKESQLKMLQSELKATKNPPKKLLDLVKTCQREAKGFSQSADSVSKAMLYIKKDVPYIITSEEELKWNSGKRRKEKTIIHKFQLLDIKLPYQDLIKNLQCVVLASGTSTTSLLTSDPKHITIKVPHPIDVARRIIYVNPVGPMTYTEKYNTVKSMAAEIIRLHNGYRRNTIVHCHTYEITQLLLEQLSNKVDHIILQNRNSRKEDLKFWMEHDDTVFLSVNYNEGLDLSGPKYPVNIIAKVPFPSLASEWWKSRNKIDNWSTYNITTAVSLIQACGRTTRTPTDYSEISILDSSFSNFFNRNKQLFPDWFVCALRN